MLLSTLILALVLVAPVPVTPATAQPLPARNTVYVQLGGNAIAYSLNYERLFTTHLTGRIGAMYARLDADDLEDLTETEGKESLVFVPVMVNYLLGTGKHRVELGAGPLLVTSSEGGGGIAATATAGYLYRPPEDSTPVSASRRLSVPGSFYPGVVSVSATASEPYPCRFRPSAMNIPSTRHKPAQYHDLRP